MSLRFGHCDEGYVDPDRTRLFMFQTSRSWPRSGGGYVVVARSFKEAISMFPRAKGHEFLKAEPDDGKQHLFTWVLVEVMESFDRSSRVVFANWHVS